MNPSNQDTRPPDQSRSNISDIIELIREEFSAKLDEIGTSLTGEEPEPEPEETPELTAEQIELLKAFHANFKISSVSIYTGSKKEFAGVTFKARGEKAHVDFVEPIKGEEALYNLRTPDNVLHVDDSQFCFEAKGHSVFDAVKEISANFIFTAK